MKRLLFFVFALLASWAAAQGVLPVPELTARVIDQTNTLDAIQRKGLEDKLAAFEQRKGTQIVVLMVPTTQPEDIANVVLFLASEETGYITGQVVPVTGGWLV